MKPCGKTAAASAVTWPAACVSWAFRELRLARVVSIAHPENAASRRVMEKLGFRVVAERDSEVWGRLLVHALDRRADESAFGTHS